MRRTFTALFLSVVFLVSLSFVLASADTNKGLKDSVSSDAEPNYLSSLDLAEGVISERPPYSKGDLNGDGEISCLDFLYVKRVFLGTFTPSVKQRFAADVNNDGAVTAVDFLMIRKFYNRTYFITPYVLNPQIELTEEQLETIKADYVEYLRTTVGEEHFTSLTVSDIYVNKYFGPYSGCYSLMISHREECFIEALTTDFVAGYKFLYNDGQQLKIYSDHTFVNLKTAYDMGIITKEDVKDLSWYFRSYGLN